MAKTETLTLEIEAQLSRALSDIKRLEKEIKDLQKAADKPIEPKVDTRDAQRSVEDLLQTVEKLSSEDAQVVLALKGAEIQQEISDLLIDISKLDSEEATIDIKVERVNELTGDLDKIKGAIREIDGAKAEPTVTLDTSGVQRQAQGAEDRIRGIQGSADGAKSALANMVGNAVQDLGALGGVAGPAGVAIGQLGEYLADARLRVENAGKSFGSLAASFAPAAIATAGIGIAFTVATKAIEAFGNKGRDVEADVKAMTDSLTEGIGRLDEFRDAADEAFAVGAADPMEQWNNQIIGMIENLEDGEEQLDKTSTAVVNLSDTAQGGALNLADLAEIFTNLDQNSEGFISRQLQLQGVSKGLADEIAGLMATGLSWSDAMDTILDQHRDASGLFDAEGQAILNQIPAWEARGQALEHVIDLHELLKLDESADQFLIEQASIDDSTEALVAQARARQLARDGVVDESEALRIYIGLLGEENAAQTDSADATDRINRLNEQFVEDVNAAIAVGAKQLDAHNRLKLSTEELADALLALEDPATALPDVWEALVTEMGKGAVDMERAKELTDQLAQATNLSADEIAAMAIAEAELRKQELAKKLEADEEAMREFEAAVAEANATLNTAEARADAFGRALDRVNAPSDLTQGLEIQQFVNDLNGVQEAYEGLTDAQIEAVNAGELDLVPDDWEEIRHMPEELQPVLAALGSFRDVVGTEMTQAFETGGAAGVKAWAADTTTAVLDMLESTGIATRDASGELTDAAKQVLETLGLLPEQTDLFINISIDEQKLAVLEDLAGALDLPSDVATNVTVALNNDDPATAARLINEYLLSITEPGGKARQVDFIVNAETGEVETVLTEVTKPREVGVSTGTPDTSATDATLQSGYWVNGIFVPIATSEDPSVAETGTTLDAFGNPITTQVIVPKSDTLGAMNDLINAVTAPRTMAITTTADNAGQVGGILDAVAKARTVKFLTSYGTAASQADDALNEVAEPRTAKFFTSYGTAAAEAEAALDTVAKPRTADITAKTHGSLAADMELTFVARDRTADINAIIENYFEAEQRLERLARDRFSTIFVNTVTTGGGSTGGGAGPGPGPGTLMAPAPATAGLMTAEGPTALAAAPLAISSPSVVSVAPGGATVTNHFHVAVQAAVIGNRSEVERIISKSLRSHARLNGRRN